jgi:hypothetical protein
MNERMKRLWHALAQGARDVGAKHVEQPDQRQRVAGHLGRQAVVLEVTGHVHADEHHLEAAHKVARHQQIEAGVAEGLAQGLANGLVTLRWGGPLKARFAQAKGQRNDQQHQPSTAPAMPAASPGWLISHPSTGTIRNCPNEPAAAATPMAHERLSGAICRPSTP